MLALQQCKDLSGDTAPIELSRVFLQMLQSLVQAGADDTVPLPDGRTVVHLAVAATRNTDPHCKMIRAILDRHPDLAGRPDNVGVRPRDLMKAAEARNWAREPSWSSLLDSACEPYSIEEKFLSACASGNPDLVAKLLEELPSLAWAKDNQDRSSLDIASDSGQVPVIDVLLRAEPSLLVQKYSDPPLASALHYAASAGVLEAVRALLHAGALIDVRDDEGKTPLDRALESKANEEVGLVWRSIDAIVDK